MCTRPSSKSSQNFYLINTDLQGVTTQQAEFGKHIFAGLKFTETSYKHEGSKFNLVVALLIKEQGQLHPSVIDCKISSPLYIYSHFRVNDIPNDKETVNSNIFFPDMFTKQLVKRKKDAQEEITNDMTGFLSYFTAPNIRYKIKNPLFLAYRFSNFVTLYYNILKCSDVNDAVRKITDYFSLIPNLKKPKCYSRKSGNNVDKINMDALICLVFRRDSESIHLRDIIDKYGSFDNSFMNILCDISLIPKKFTPIYSPEQIQRSYSQHYMMRQPNLASRPLADSNVKTPYMDTLPNEFIPMKQIKTNFNREPCRTVINVSKTLDHNIKSVSDPSIEFQYVKSLEEEPVIQQNYTMPSIPYNGYPNPYGSSIYSRSYFM